MEVIRGLINIKDRHKGSVVTVGNFDGVHTGHKKILDQMKVKARELGAPTMLICFEPLPREFFDFYNAPARLTRFREKVELLDQLGIDVVMCLKFDKVMKEIAADRFIEILAQDLGVKAVYIGDDFRFGQNRSGDFSMLAAAGRDFGFEVNAFETVTHEEVRVSSTRIRECLQAGDFPLAQSLLGHPYFIAGKVVYGRQVGRTLDVPTINVQLHRYVAPITGVFACETEIDGATYKGVANVGVRPTFEEELPKPVLEVHLFDFNRDVYGANVKVVFRHKLRDEQKFDGLDALRAAIHRDIEAARAYFANRSDKAN